MLGKSLFIYQLLREEIIALKQQVMLPERKDLKCPKPHLA